MFGCHFRDLYRQHDTAITWPDFSTLGHIIKLGLDKYITVLITYDYLNCFIWYATSYFIHNYIGLS